MQRSAIIPYEGTKPYIFVSYAHKDSDRVMRILENLDDRGYRIWYDDGIAPGSEWPENIAQHLNECHLTMAFISPNSIASDNCRREITFALSKKKAFLAVLLEESEMPLGMEMQLSAQQCVMRHGYRSEEKFIDKICACPDLEPCRELPPAEPEEMPEVVPEDPKPVKVKKDKPRTKEKKPSKVKWGRIGIAAALLVLAAMVISMMTHVKITDDKKVALNENYLSLGYETVTKDMVRKINRLKKLTDLSFRNCEFESGAMEALRLPENLQSFTISDCTGVDDLSCLADAESLRNLYLRNCGLTDDLIPNVKFANLRTAHLSGNPGVTDLGKIGEWAKVTDLDVTNTGIKDLDGLSCDELMTLNFSGTGVSDVAPLAAFSQLATIRGSDTNVTSLDSLAALTELKTLEFNNCAITTVRTPFASLRLVHLSLENNGLTDISGFENCTLLKTVQLAGNQISDISFLSKNVQTLENMTLSGNLLEEEDLRFLIKCEGMKELELDGIPLQNIDFVTSMYHLTRLSAVGCGLADIGGIQNNTNLKWLRLTNNQITDISPLKNLTALRTLDLGYNLIESLAGIPEVSNFRVLSILGVPAKRSTLPSVGGDALLVDYTADLLGTQMDFSRYYVMNCPADKQVTMEDQLGSYRLRLISTPEEVVEYMAEYDLDYSFLTELQ